jgi:beta-1,4-mannosyltransferase
MQKKALFIFPITNETYKQGANTYIKNLIAHLSQEYTIINKKTTLGLLDLLSKINKCDVVYFNWIEDVPDRRFGLLQIPVLVLVLFIAKIKKIKIIWFIHNNISHTKTRLRYKKFIVGLMKRHATLILSHSHEVKLDIPRFKLHVFHHPIETNGPVGSGEPYEFDLLIWGTISPYKGISEFLDFVAATPSLKEFNILIAGKFVTDQYYEEVEKKKPENVTIINKMLPEEELKHYFSVSRYVLFTYNSPSVLSSAALCKTLSFEKEVIAPNTGSFKELGKMKLVYNYDSFASLETLLKGLKYGSNKRIDQAALANYIQTTTWKDFARFLVKTIDALYEKTPRKFNKV